MGWRRSSPLTQETKPGDDSSLKPCDAGAPTSSYRALGDHVRTRRRATAMLFIGSPPSGLKWQQGGRRNRARAGTASRSLNLANLTSFALSLAMSARLCAPRGFDAVSVATASTASRGDRHTHHRRRRDDSSHRAVANQRTRIGGRLRSSTLEGVSSTQEAGYYDIARRDGIIQVRSFTRSRKDTPGRPR